MASETATRVPATTIWFVALPSWPAPDGPRCVIRFPIAARTRLAFSRASASPPTKKVSVPSAAPFWPPETGASRNARPAFAEPLADRARRLRRDRRAVDDDGSRRGSPHGPVLAEVDLLDLGRVGQARDDDVRSRGRPLRRTWPRARRPRAPARTSRPCPGSGLRRSAGSRLSRGSAPCRHPWSRDPRIRPRAS